MRTRPGLQGISAAARHPSTSLAKIDAWACGGGELGRGVHHAKARVLSITQATELGTIYDVDEVCALSQLYTPL